MLSDGALRMLVLLHFHTLGYSPIQLAYMFVLYELAGVFTNILAGWIGSRYGLSSTLVAGLALQIVAVLALSQLHQDWVLAYSVTYVMFVQGLSGIAKDLSKMSAKSAVKLLSPLRSFTVPPLYKLVTSEEDKVFDHILTSVIS